MLREIVEPSMTRYRSEFKEGLLLHHISMSKSNFGQNDSLDATSSKLCNTFLKPGILQP